MKMSQLEPLVESENNVYNRIIAALKMKTPVVYSKINHGFWERLVEIERMGHSYLETNRETAAIIDKQGARPSPYFVELGFVSELLEIFQNIPRESKNFIFSAGLSSWPNSEQIKGPSIELTSLLYKKIESLVPKNARNSEADGMEFKRAIINGTFKQFSNIIKNKSFIFVANKGLKCFPNFIGAKDCEFIEIDRSNARCDRYEILQKIEKAISVSNTDRRVLFQAGGSLTAWLIHNLHKSNPKTTLIDLGVAADICNPTLIFTKDFGKAYRTSILSSINSIHSGWIDKWIRELSHEDEKKGHNLYLLKSARTPFFIPSYKKAGVRISNEVLDAKVPINKPVSFIENKKIDYTRLDDYLSLTTKGSHTGDEGAVSRLLEQCLHAMLKLPENRKVVMCNSCSTGIQIAVGVHSINSSEQLSWVASAFGSKSSNIGLLENVNLLDCNATGYLDVTNLKRQQKRNFGGVLYSSVFGLNMSSWTSMREYCRTTNKKLIIDNALGLKDRPKTEPSPEEIEVVSCHQTNPWGVGEGGFLILDEKDEDLARSLIDFGAQKGRDISRYSQNARLSDLSSAAILGRLERTPHWAFYYRNQEQRIKRIIQRNVPSLTELPLMNLRQSPAMSLPFLANFDVRFGSLKNKHFHMGKLYSPLRSVRDSSNQNTTIDYPNANFLYNRIINIPTHPNMRHVDSEDISIVLNTIFSGQ